MDYLAPIERKVKAATVGAYASGLVGLAITGAISGASANVIPILPQWVSTIIAPLVPALITLASGWVAKHSPRAPTVVAAVPVVPKSA